MWGCPCKTVDLYLGQNSALVCSKGQLSRLSTKYLTTASRLRGDPQSWLIFVILFCFFFKNAQWRYCWGPTRTEGQLMRRQQQHLTVCLHRSLPAACWPRERASGESAAGPEPPSLDRCCKLDELVPNWSEEENKRFARYFVCRSMYFFSYYIPLAAALMWVELQFHYYDAVLTFSSQEAATIHRDCFIDLSENCTPQRNPLHFELKTP